MVELTQIPLKGLLFPPLYTLMHFPKHGLSFIQFRAPPTTFRLYSSCLMRQRSSKCFSSWRTCSKTLMVLDATYWSNLEWTVTVCSLFRARYRASCLLQLPHQDLGRFSKSSNSTSSKSFECYVLSKCCGFPPQIE